MKDVDFDSEGMPFFNDTIVYKGENLLTTQEGYLYYAPNFGIDLKRFIDPDVVIQTETFKSYAVNKLVENGINITKVERVDRIFETVFNFFAEEQDLEGLVSQ